MPPRAPVRMSAPHGGHKLRENIRVALRSAKKAYGRLREGRQRRRSSTTRSCRRMLRAAVSLRDAGEALHEFPMRRKHRGSCGKLLLLGIISAGMALTLSAGLRQRCSTPSSGPRSVRLLLDHVARPGRLLRLPGRGATTPRPDVPSKEKRSRGLSCCPSSDENNLTTRTGRGPVPPSRVPSSWRRRPQRSADRGREGEAHRRRHALERRAARRGGLDVRPRRARGRRLARAAALLLRHEGAAARRGRAARLRDPPGRLDAAAPARTADDFIDALVAALERTSRTTPTSSGPLRALHAVAAQRRDRRRARRAAAPHARARRRAAGRKQDEGVLHLPAEPEAVADVLFSLGDGLALRMLTEPHRDFAPTLDAGVLAIRALLD